MIHTQKQNYSEAEKYSLVSWCSYCRVL